MARIELQTYVHSTVEICFDLSRSIELHEESTAKTKEKAVAGVTTGLINFNETVTWQATHLGFRQHLTSAITAFDRPFHFRDEQTKGIFRSLCHDHYFEQATEGVIITDIFVFSSPCGIVGRLFDKLFLTAYLKRFLQQRNALIKQCAEDGRWVNYIDKKRL